MDEGKHVWTQQEIAAINENLQNGKKALEGIEHGDLGTDNLSGDPCICSDGRSGYMLSSGDKYVCDCSGSQPQ